MGNSQRCITFIFTVEGFATCVRHLSSCITCAWPLLTALPDAMELFINLTLFSPCHRSSTTHQLPLTWPDTLENPQRMCIATLRTHSICQHRAQGTAGPASQMQHCATAQQISTASSLPFNVPCPVRSVQLNYQSAGRPYCDDCIIAGVEVFKAKGFHPDVYAISMGVSLSELLRHHPGWNLR